MRVFEGQRWRSFAVGPPRLHAAGPANVRVLLGPELIVVGANVVAIVGVVVVARDAAVDTGSVGGVR